jgi:hypothetical protein
MMTLSSKWVGKGLKQSLLDDRRHMIRLGSVYGK